MSKLDEVIASVAYILDCLMTYRNAIESGDCNSCKNKDCKWKPKPGQFVRYNCPHYKRDGNPMDDYIGSQALCQYALNQKDKSVTCGYPVSRWTGNTNFCPNCGAKMDALREG